MVPASRAAEVDFCWMPEEPVDVKVPLCLQPPFLCLPLFSLLHSAGRRARCSDCLAQGNVRMTVSWGVSDDRHGVSCLRLGIRRRETPIQPPRQSCVRGCQGVISAQESAGTEWAWFSSPAQLSA